MCWVGGGRWRREGGLEVEDTHRGHEDGRLDGDHCVEGRHLGEAHGDTSPLTHWRVSLCMHPLMAYLGHRSDTYHSAMVEGAHRLGKAL